MVLEAAAIVAVVVNEFVITVGELTEYVQTQLGAAVPGKTAAVYGSHETVGFVESATSAAPL
jgi:hypothetical protein